MFWIKRVSGYALTFVFVGIVVVLTFALFGTAILAAAAMVLAIPLVFPLTTTLALLVVGGGVVWTYMRRDKSIQDQEG